MKNPFSVFTTSLIGPLFGFVSIIGLGCLVILPILHYLSLLSKREESIYILIVILLSCFVGGCSTIGLLRRIGKETKVSLFVYSSSCAIFVILAGIAIFKFVNCMNV